MTLAAGAAANVHMTADASSQAELTLERTLMRCLEPLGIGVDGDSGGGDGGASGAWDGNTAENERVPLVYEPV